MRMEHPPSPRLRRDRKMRTAHGAKFISDFGMRIANCLTHFRGRVAFLFCERAGSIRRPCESFLRMAVARVRGASRVSFRGGASSVWPNDGLQPEFAMFREHLACNSPKRTFRTGNKKRRLFRAVHFSIVFHRPIKRRTEFTSSLVEVANSQR